MGYGVGRTEVGVLSTFSVVASTMLPSSSIVRAAIINLISG